MTEGSPTESQLYERISQLLQVHENLLQDGRRNRLFYRALKKTVTPDAHVLDIGSGTGIWAIVAAKLGARRVVAVEQNPHLAGVIRAMALEQQVADRIEVVTGDSRAVDLPREFDLVVSETIGYAGFEEDITSILFDARARFLKPDGKLIPQTVALMAAPVRVPKPLALPAGLPFSCRFFELLTTHRAVTRSAGDSWVALAPPQTLRHVDLRNAPASLDLTDLTARWPLPDCGALAGVAVWADVTLTKGVRLDTRRTSSWSPILLRVRPFQAARGDLEFRFTLNRVTSFWTAILTDGAHQETQSFSPAYAFAELEARMRGAPSVFDHLERVGLMPKQ